jgi:hypothetical protein
MQLGAAEGAVEGRVASTSLQPPTFFPRHIRTHTSLLIHQRFTNIASPLPPKSVRVGDRIAQLVLERIATPEVEEVASLEDTERGAGGFGSTGVAAKQ